MIIYIPCEIPVRELPGYLLLALTASARGHQVVISSGLDFWLYKRLNLLSKGCYMIKNMNVPSVSNTVYKEFIRDGFDMYCQEQEPSIIYGKFETYLETLNITKDQNVPFKGVFCWGERDTVKFKNFFKSKEEIFFNTGSLRLDLWKTKYKNLHKNFNKVPDKPYILFISNFSYIMGKDNWTKISLVERNLEMLKTEKAENNFIRRVQQDMSIAGDMIIAIKHISTKYPEHDILLRPHPADSVSNWKNIFINNKNVKVIGNQDSITPWIYNSSAIIQNGCTSAIEASVMEKPIISYGPDRVYDNLDIPNSLGYRARTINELTNSLELIFNQNNYSEIQENNKTILEKIVSMEESDTALKMIKIMERNSPGMQDKNLNNTQLQLIKMIKILKTNIDIIRKYIGVKGLDTKDPILSLEETEDTLRIMSEILNIPMPKIKSLNKSFLLIS